MDGVRRGPLVQVGIHGVTDGLGCLAGHVERHPFPLRPGDTDDGPNGHEHPFVMTSVATQAEPMVDRAMVASAQMSIRNRSMIMIPFVRFARKIVI